MSKFSDLLPNIKDMNPAKMFKSRDGHPWLQSVARNVMQSQVGEKNANYLNEHLLGDMPKTVQTPGFSGLLQSTPNGTTGTPMTPTTPAPTVGSPTTPRRPNDAATMLQMQQLMQQLGGGMNQGGM